MYRRRTFMSLGLAFALAIAVASPAPALSSPNSLTRDISGLLVVSDRNADIPDSLADAYGPVAKKVPRARDFAAAMSDRVTLPGGTLSRRATERIKNDVFDLAIAPAFAASDAWQSEVDPISGLVTLRVGKLTPDLAAAVVSQFGTENVAIRVEKRPDTHPDSRNSDTSPRPGDSGGPIYTVRSDGKVGVLRTG